MNEASEHPRQDREPTGMETQRLSPRLFLSLLLLSGALMAACLMGLWMLHRDELESENENLRRLALTLSEHTALALREIDIVLRETRPYLTREALESGDNSLHKILKKHYTDLPQGQALMVFGADAVMRGHSREFPTPRVNIADRDYFLGQQGGGDTLFISAPLRNRVNGRWMLSLSRRLSNQDGVFAGVVMAAVEIDYFSRLYQSLNLPPAARLELIRADGLVLVVSPFDENRLAKPSQPESTERSLVVTGEVPGLPLTIRLSMPRFVALHTWMKHMGAAGLGMLAVVAGVAALTATRRSYVRQLRQRTELLQQSEAALRASEARHRTIVETANEGICTMDAQLRITYVNRVMAEFLGCQGTEMLGRSLADFTFPDDAPQHAVQAQSLRQRSCSERRLRHKNGQEIWVIMSSTPMQDEAGAFLGSFAMFTDITLRKLEEKFREGIEGVLRHDLRSPLVNMSYIPGMLLEEGNLTPQQVLAVEETRRYVRRMLRMVDAYLGLSRIEKEAGALDVRPVNLAPLLEDVAQELEKLLKYGGKELAFNLDGAPLSAAHAVVVPGEEVLLHTLFANLIKNALEAAPDGTRVDVELRPLGQELEISVHNQGAVPEEIRERFFQKYVTAGKRKGTGLGAYSAKLIAQAHGGGIALDTADPGATTVRVRLPLTAQAHRPEEVGFPAA